jgi:phosphohistidine phosphatase
MALLMLLRHGIAEEPNADRRDAERRLTGEGKRKTREVAAGMAVLELPVEAVLTSPLVRARQTAEIVADVYGLDEARLEIVEALAPGHDADAVFRALRPHQAAAGVLLVGHEPDMGELTSTLLVGTPGLVGVRFKKAGLAAVSVASLPPLGAGVLELLAGPALLRRLGRAGIVG